MTATLRDGRVHQLDSPVSLMGFSPLPVVDRIRMGAALATLKAMPNPRLLEGQTAMDWTRRWMGANAYETVWEPLLRGKFGDAAPEIAMPWFWARVHDRTQALGYLRGGFQQLYNRLAERIRQAGGETRFGVSVTSVRADGDGLLVETDQGAERFDRVVSTFAPRLTARLVPELPDSWRSRSTSGVAPMARTAWCSRWIDRCKPPTGSTSTIRASRSWPSSSTPTTCPPTSTVAATSSTSATTGRWTTRS